MSKVEELIAASRLSELMNKKEEDKNSKTLLWVLQSWVQLQELQQSPMRYIVFLHPIISKTSKKISRMILMMISSMKMIRYKRISRKMYDRGSRLEAYQVKKKASFLLFS